MERRSPDILKSPVNLSQIMHKGGVHSSRIKCKGVQITQINWQELANFLKNVEEHPSREPKYWMLTAIFQYVSVQKWMLLYIFQEMGELLSVNLCYLTPLHLIREL